MMPSQVVCRSAGGNWLKEHWPASLGRVFRSSPQGRDRKNSFWEELMSVWLTKALINLSCVLVFVALLTSGLASLRYLVLAIVCILYAIVGQLDSIENRHLKRLGASTVSKEPPS